MEHLQQIGNQNICPVIIIFRDGKIIIGLRNYTQEKYKLVSVWTVPGGRCDAGETIEQTLRRETMEEVGIDNLSIERFLGIVDGAKIGDIVYVYFGKTDQEPKLMEPEKFSEWKWESTKNINRDSFINPRLLELILKNK